MMGDLMRRVRNALAFGTTTGPVTMADGVPQAQVRLTPIEVLTMRIVEQRGVASSLPPGTPVLAMFQSGDRSNGVVCGSAAPGSRPALPGPEDVALYGYGYAIRLAADGVHISGAPDVWIDGALHVKGDLRVDGEVTGRGGQVTLTQHRHPGVNAPPSAGT